MVRIIPAGLPVKMEFLMDVLEAAIIELDQAKPLPLLVISLEVGDPEVATELLKHAEGLPRERFALGALRLGVLALRQAAGEVDAVAVRNAAQDLLEKLGQLLATRGAELTTELSGALRQYFDPTTGLLSNRIESLLRNDGELDRALRQHLATENSTIATALAAHLGEGSSIYKLLSPTDAGGVKAQVEGALESALEEQQEQFLKEFSLDNKESALARLLSELALSNGELRSDLKTQVDGLVREFSLDKPDSALSRLVAKVENAHRAIADEFSTDNEQSAIARLSQMLRDTSQQIDRNLTLDDDGSSLSRLKRELQTTIEGLVSSNTTFQAEVRTTLATLQARREEAARSTRHGNDFEDQIGLVVAAEAQRLNDLCEKAGAGTGVIKNCKTGDFVTTLGPDSAAPGVRIVWEAKEDKSYDLKRALAEMDVARKNRQAQIGIFVFSRLAAPEGLQPFTRYGNDVVVIWDAENPDSDLNIKVAYSVARALVIREAHESVESEHALNAIDLATRAIEKQLDHLDQIKIWAETVKSNGDKVAERAGRMRADLAREVEALDRHVSGLKTNGACG
jgi:hypothetical protein